MNILQLIQNCQVEWKSLGEVADYEQPTKYLVSSNNYNDEYQTPVLTAGKTFILGYTDETHGIYLASSNPVIIFDDFTTANKWVDFDFKAKSSAMKMITSKDENQVLLKYIYYWLNTLPNEQMENDHKRQWISNYAKKKIPIPPLEIQEKIVKILDKLTKLTAELTAEHALRQKQCQYYRDFLLDCDNPKNPFLRGLKVEWKSLGEVFHLKNGYTPSKSNKEYWVNGTIPWFRMEDIRENGRILDNALQQVSESAVKGGKLFPANSIIMATTATIGEHALVTVNCLSNQQLTNFSIKSEFSKLLDIKFAFYYFFIIDKQAKKIANKSSMPIISLKELSKFPIPIPPLEIQAQIVAILDKFDTLTHSISEGLPREIELRQKQYEYYRELLLGFIAQEN